MMRIGDDGRARAQRPHGQPVGQSAADHETINDGDAAALAHEMASRVGMTDGDRDPRCKARFGQSLLETVGAAETIRPIADQSTPREVLEADFVSRSQWI